MSGMFSTSTPTSTGAAQNAGAGVGKLLQAGGSLLGGGTPLTSAGTNYYRALLSGPAAAGVATAPAAANISEGYKGAEAGVKATQFGAGRDVNLGELGRARQGAISGLYTGVQPAAANALVGTGQTMTGQGIGAFTGAVGGGTGLATQQTQQMLAEKQLGLSAGGGIGAGALQLAKIIKAGAA